MALLDETDAGFEATRGPEHAARWTDVAGWSRADGAARGQLARHVLPLMGERRADEELGGRV